MDDPKLADLHAWGWDDALEAAFRPHAADGLVAARVLVEHKGAYRVTAGGEAELKATVSGKLRHESVGRAGFPVVGDFVAMRPSASNGPAIVHAVLPRRTAIVRKVAGEKTEEQVVASNVDVVFIVSSLDKNLNLRRLERYLALVWKSGATPVIVLNKSDLHEDAGPLTLGVEQIAAGVPVHAISARTGLGLAALDPYLGARRTVGALGSSGVGKSTLINGLLGREAQATGAVRASDDQGRHTTTHRELFMLPGGAMIIDTPGMRELQLWDVDEGLDTAFDDLEAVAAACKFRDCRHGSEPGCAVRAAVERKELTPDRVASYAKLVRELEALHLRQDERAVLARKRSDKLGSKPGKPIKDRE